VASSEATAKICAALGIEVLDLNAWPRSGIRRGADEIDRALAMIKGAAARSRREKIVAAGRAQVRVHRRSVEGGRSPGRFPLPVEVIPMARSYVARELVKLGGSRRGGRAS
jgi:ribose 5-phosphate isomerase A